MAGRYAWDSPPFSPSGARGRSGGGLSPHSPLGMSISRHEHFIKPVPPTYVTEYEDRYRDPRTYGNTDIFVKSKASIKCRSPKKSAEKSTTMLGAIFRCSVTHTAVGSPSDSSGGGAGASGGAPLVISTSV